MARHYLATSLRKQLGKVVGEARAVAEQGVATAIRRLGAGDAKAPEHLREPDRALRNRLRAHGRSLGDKREPSGMQAVAKLTEAAAYEHWHRMLFARFLAERRLLIHPDFGGHVTLEDCKELTTAELPDAWAVAEHFAARMLPGIFRPDDPALALPLAPEHQLDLQRLVIGLDPAVFEADDSLGWTYQFWRAAEKDAVNKSGRKIGADELPAVTQLFTEPYMVQFLLHNTLGAWWAGKRLAAEPALARDAADEAGLRAAFALPGIDWNYLRFVREDGAWRPAAGVFPGWPRTAAEITVMDPCCGSGHFLVEAFAILAALRTAEERLAPAEAVGAVLRENLFGLEIDGRCVQIAAFAVAMAAWGHAGAAIDLPRPHIAWVGQTPAVGKAEWLRLAEAMAASGPVPPRRDLLSTDDNLFSAPDRWALELLWGLFAQAPTLGSLLDPSAAPPMFAKSLAGLEATLAKAAFGESDADELALAARGMADAAGMLVRRYTLLATNVPYLGRGKQAPALANHLARSFADSKADLATAVLSRLLGLAAPSGTVATVSLHNWLFLKSYRHLRERVLTRYTIDFLAALGEEAWEWFGDRGPFALLSCLSATAAAASSTHFCIDTLAYKQRDAKIRCLIDGSVALISQSSHRLNSDFVITTVHLEKGRSLAEFAFAVEGLSTGDGDRYVRSFWEILAPRRQYNYYHGTPDSSSDYAGLSQVLFWEEGRGALSASEGARVQGQPAWGHDGVIIGMMRHLPTAIYFGEIHEKITAAIIVPDRSKLPAVYTFLRSPEYRQELRKVDIRFSVATGTLTKPQFDISHWQTIAAERYPDGLPEPYSDDATQWLFHGNPARAEPGMALHVALARLAGYRWPAESDAEMRLSAEARDWIARAAGLSDADPDGILCLPAVGGERPLAERLRAFLAAAFGHDWNAGTERRLLAETAERAKEKPAADLDAWLRRQFFRQHCALFHQRPFLWQIGDGQADGFSAVLHYHRLTKANLQKLTYSVLGDWLARMKAAGDARRVEAARILQQKLELILAGEDPYDIFVRWKPLDRQPLGWDPDLDDGVRMNIRPFVEVGILTHQPNIKWTKDRGTDVASAPWYKVHKGERINDRHTTLEEKREARGVVAGG